ncbi:MarR family winged helix-turn-helix transcriptional regulator [Clostridium aestuarii]|uniref:MarR family winged helix-turn-helix transcriptional regulator n=1 Tax=Clostridium aestuarii TaxID=338193 RepID=A0ABT4D2V6_9CLOT|nr:MarR family winged helix-turn-helix transcriptional regulator [Clostridium aestuarii]MCY6484625.1 MarR family winged helix-turn-helix transcriptional regulator [Clostridium aestuarii]
MEIDFITEHDSIGKYIDIISRYLFYYIFKQVEPYNLQKHQYKVLIELYNNQGICQQELVDLLKLRKADVAKAIKKLIDIGYIYKKKDSRDKRIHHLYVTEKGIEIKNDIIFILSESSKILSQNISKKELEITKKVMKQMAENIFSASNNLENK